MISFSPPLWWSKSLGIITNHQPSPPVQRNNNNIVVWLFAYWQFTWISIFMIHSICIDCILFNTSHQSIRLCDWKFVGGSHLTKTFASQLLCSFKRTLLNRTECLVHFCMLAINKRESNSCFLAVYFLQSGGIEGGRRRFVDHHQSKNQMLHGIKYIGIFSAYPNIYSPLKITVFSSFRLMEYKIWFFLSLRL